MKRALLTLEELLRVSENMVLHYDLLKRENRSDPFQEYEKTEMVRQEGYHPSTRGEGSGQRTSSTSSTVPIRHTSQEG